MAGLLISAVLLRLRMKALDDLAESQAQLDHQATYDPLTDVLNRNGLERAIPSVSATALRSGNQVLVWFVDVRGLKRANDEHGHAFGDAIIRATADALRASVRANDLIAPLGRRRVRRDRRGCGGLGRGARQPGERGTRRGGRELVGALDRDP